MHLDIRDRRLYVSEYLNDRIQVFNLTGESVRQYGVTAVKGRSSGQFNYPTDVALLPKGELVVADAYNNRVQVFSAEGEFLGKWGGPLGIGIPGGGHGWFRTATAVAAGPEGKIFVADFYNHRIQKFSPQGEFLATFGSQGSGPGQFERPIDMAIDDQGNVFVVDFGNNRIQKFGRDPVTR